MCPSWIPVLSPINPIHILRTHLFLQVAFYFLLLPERLQDAFIIIPKRATCFTRLMFLFHEQYPALCCSNAKPHFHQPVFSDLIPPILIFIRHSCILNVHLESSLTNGAFCTGLLPSKFISQRICRSLCSVKAFCA